jgi:hypothetical protein
MQTNISSHIPPSLPDASRAGKYSLFYLDNEEFGAAALKLLDTVTTVKAAA